MTHKHKSPKPVPVPSESSSSQAEELYDLREALEFERPDRLLNPTEPEPKFAPSPAVVIIEQTPEVAPKKRNTLFGWVRHKTGGGSEPVVDLTVERCSLTCNIL